MLVIFLWSLFITGLWSCDQTTPRAPWFWCQTENPTYATFILYFHCTNNIWSIFYHSYLRLHTCMSVCMSGLIKLCIKMDHFFCLIKWVKTTVCLFIFLYYEWGTPGYGHWAIFIHASPNECFATLQLWLKAVNGSQEMLKLLFCCFVTGEQLMTSNLSTIFPGL